MGKQWSNFQLDRTRLTWLNQNRALGVPRSAVAEAMIADGCALGLARELARALHLI